MFWCSIKNQSFLPTIKHTLALLISLHNEKNKSFTMYELGHIPHCQDEAPKVKPYIKTDKGAQGDQRKMETRDVKG